MKEEERGNITQDEQRELPVESAEQVMNTPETNDIAAEPQDILDRDEDQQYSRESFLVHASSRSSHIRADSVPMAGISEIVIDGLMVSPIGSAPTSEDDSSQQTMEKWALDNAPPPIKLHRQGETSEESSPKELSPPPSPKRMREVARKGKVFSQGSI